MKKKILMIGYSMVFLNHFKERKDIGIYIIEEKELFEKNKLHTIENPLIQNVFFGDYIDSEDCIDIAVNLDKEIGFDAVFPSKDYAVRTSGKIAEKLQLPGLGALNSEILTNKIFLRNFCEKLNIPHPRYSEIMKKEELREFFTGSPIIFKPATMQASMGISIIKRDEEINTGWDATTSTKENEKISISRNVSRKNIAEDYLEGKEFSIETLVKNNKIIFSNITEKIVYADSFVEEGHIVPAKLTNENHQALLKEKQKLVSKMKIDSGLLHSEWKLHEGKATLIECAGRIPGDYIYDLISYSYNFDFLNEYLMVLANGKANISNEPTKVSVVRYFNSKPGVLKKIVGLDSLLIPEVVDWSIEKAHGDTISDVCSSWDRIGHFVVVSDSYETSLKISDSILKQVEFIV
ncbi:ATP-grasp domain-containing protein [Enterococcus plantarum]|uniref:ATP-grasp domain-containing protein n=1 Tax=Enterococcus plantarum TaxID=1077675 RepID=UPI001A9060E4|nr:ATP-grasp domain-containing protein [Enterococcus plantarum]MBO0468533.1 ATP-grasp domain-containing protein [Enterococcus plantarum]